MRGEVVKQDNNLCVNSTNACSRTFLSTGWYLEMTDLIDTFDYAHSPADGWNDKINNGILLYPDMVVS